MKAKSGGYNLIEVPVSYRKRVWGNSHLSLHTILSFIVQIFQLRLAWRSIQPVKPK